MNNKVRDLKWYQNRVKKLIEINKTCKPQRSKMWYEARNKCITASEASSALPKIEEICSTYEKLFNVKLKYNPNQNLSSFDSYEDYIINKCKSFYGENTFKDNIYTLHGKKFESIATRLYRKVYNTDVLEFGLLPHPRLKWLAASPDGCTNTGIMLEIKCPNKMYYNPSPTYFTQMQIQMETADLDECDFLVCEIKELSSEEDYINKIIDESEKSEFPNSCKQYKGILLNKNNEYIYPPDNLNTIDDFLNWSNNTILQYKQENIEIIPNYYIIQEWNIIRIQRNKEWFNIIKPYLKKTIDIITKYQQDKNAFEQYCEQIYLLKNKKNIDIYNNTECMIEDDDEDN